MRRPEQTIHLAVADRLRWRAAPGVFWCHYPAGGYRRPIEANILQELGARAGMPDLLLVRDGRLYGLELKAPGGRLSPAQRDAHEALCAAGATVATATGLEDALAQLREWGLLLPDRVRLPYANDDREPVGKFCDLAKEEAA